MLFYDEGEDPNNKTKDSKSNSNSHSEIRINLGDLIGNTDLANKDFASRIYLKGVSLSLGDKIEQAKLPRPAIPADLGYWYVTPSKH